MDRAGSDISAMMGKTIKPIADVLATARKAGIEIIYLKMGWIKIFLILVMKDRLIV